MPVTQQYWRILITGVAGNPVAYQAAIAEFQLLDTENVNLVVGAGGTASASSFTGSNTAALAFDSNNSTFWRSNGAPSGGSPEWLEYAFLGAVSVVACSIRLAPPGSIVLDTAVHLAPTNFTIQSSPDNVTWTTQQTVTSYTGWEVEGQIAYFTCSPVQGHLRLSQTTVETVLNSLPNAKLSQLAVETVLNAEPHCKISQLIVEIIYPYIPSTPQIVQQFLLP